MPRIRFVLVVLASIVAAHHSMLMAQPQSDEPLPTPDFSIDRLSPSALTDERLARSILEKPGPRPAFDGFGIGLGQQDDELDDFSYNAAINMTDPRNPFLLLFSVSPDTTGGKDPDTSFGGTGRIFNVRDQAARDQVPGDLFLSLKSFELFPAPRGEGRGPFDENNTLATNQGDTGGVDMDLQPELSPVQSGGTAAKDNTDAIASPKRTTARGPGRDRVYFTVGAGSPSLDFFPPGPTGLPAAVGDMFVDVDPRSPQGLRPFVSVEQLGLRRGGGRGPLLGDDIDGLVVFDFNDDGVLQPGIDRVLFSLTPSSPTAGPNGGANVFISSGEGTNQIFIRPEELGLDPMSSDIDALEIVDVGTRDPRTVASDHAIYLYAGDGDDDQMLTEADCDRFASCFSGADVSYDADGVATHDVDVGGPSGMEFVPPVLDVEVGDTVRWTWSGTLEHNVVSGPPGIPDGLFRSGDPVASPGTTFEWTFDRAFLEQNPRPRAEYRYFCQLHFGMGMVGLIRVAGDPCAPYDIDFDGDVDCRDWRAFEQIYGRPPFSARCPLLDIPEFVAVLLGTPIEPGHVCLADMNFDGTADGLDVQPYVAASVLP